MHVGAVITLFFIMLGEIAGVAASDVRHWLHDTEWSNGDNWSAGRPPTQDEVAVMAAEGEDGGATVALPAAGRTRARALVLAREGALLLPRDGALEVTGPSPAEDEHAPAENRFERASPLAWLDPSAWGPAAGDGRWAAAVPHAERVPCRWGRAELPSERAFALRLPTRLALAVASLRVGGRLLARGSWQRLLDSHAGGAFIIREAEAWQDAGVQVVGGACEDPAGCACHAPADLAAAVERRVCALQGPRCERAAPPPCLAPVRPEGHCCYICGAVLWLRVERGRFRLSALRRALRGSTKPEGQAAGLSTHASRAPDGRVQVVLAIEDPARTDALETALALRTALLADAGLGVLSATMVTSGPALGQASWLRIVGPVFGTLVAVAVVIAAIFLLYSGWRSILSDSPEQEGTFLFARFENTETDHEAVEVLAGPLGATSQSFDNPLYRQKTCEKPGGSIQFSNLQEEDSSEVKETDT